MKHPAEFLLEKAKALGAGMAEVVMAESASLTMRRRLKKSETIERAEEKELGLRVFISVKHGYAQAMAATNDLSEKSLSQLAERVVDMAKIAPADPFTGLADKTLWGKEVAVPGLFDPTPLSEKTLEHWTAQAEDSALGTKGITNSEGAEARSAHYRFSLFTSTGFTGSYQSSSHSLSISVIAGEGTEMETDYDYAVAREVSRMRNPAELGLKAAERAIKKLKPRKIASCQIPLVFDNRVSRSLLGSLSSAINGAQVARKTTFLIDALGTKLFNKHVQVIDDPLLPYGLASRPFDDEGVRGNKRHMIENGMLTGWFLDCRSAKQLGLKTTGSASRSVQSNPHPAPSNFYMENGSVSVAEMIADIKQGLFITDAFGMGVNLVTGDYSQGASGFWIENGTLTYPVSEITIAGHLKDMFLNLMPANDLAMEYSINAPTVRIDGMTVAGK